MRLRILILGATSWLGSKILSSLSSSEDNYQLVTTLHKTSISLIPGIDYVDIKIPRDYEKVLQDYTPNIIINFLRGEDKEGYDIHNRIIDFCEKEGSHYIYTSSALALDGYNNIPLTESLLAKSVSHYGKFKALCEEALYESKLNWTILRFSSLQGFCGHKFTRNEAFLNRLLNGEDIYVDSGVVQNRMFVDDMIRIVELLIKKSITGIIHIGTLDASDEIDFLRRQAKLFGYRPDRIRCSGNQRDVNLNCIPFRIYQDLGDEFKLKEEDTLKKIKGIMEFNKYKNYEC